MEETKLTLFEHLQELRSRLWRVMIAVAILGCATLFWSREIFELLMRPVLSALPEESRSLIYTSGIEEINVLLKVGLYAGVFLATPVTLYQIWMFVAPGLLKHERLAVRPFVICGTIFFVIGAVFCYYAILPPMFSLLLKPGESGAVHDRIILARSQAETATRLFFLGETDRAADMAKTASAGLSAPGDGKVASTAEASSKTELAERISALGRLIDSTIAFGLDDSHRQAASNAINQHQEAQALFAQGFVAQSASKLEDAARTLGGVFDANASKFAHIWRSRAHLAAASNRLGEEQWTRPMLSMKEQLSLVAMLEIAFGAIFEMPLLMALLATLGILKYRWIAKYQRHAIVACVVLAAIVTPTGDAINLTLMAAPMIVCFELGVLLVWILERKRARRESETEETFESE